MYSYSISQQKYNRIRRKKAKRRSTACGFSSRDTSPAVTAVRARARIESTPLRRGSPRRATSAVERTGSNAAAASFDGEAAVAVADWAVAAGSNRTRQ